MKSSLLFVLGINLLALTGCATASPPRSANVYSRTARMAEIIPSESADVLVISAVYGSGSKFVDVTYRVNDLLREPKAYFWAKPEWLKADPTPGWKKALVIVYELDGRRGIFTTGEGGTVSVARLRESAGQESKATKAKPKKASVKRTEAAPKKAAGGQGPTEKKATKRAREKAQEISAESNPETPTPWKKLEVLKEPLPGKPFVTVQGEQFLNTGYVQWSKGLRLGDVEASAGGYVGRNGAIIIEVLVFRDGEMIFRGKGPARRIRGDTDPVEPEFKPEAPLLEPGDRVVAQQVIG